jgi:hypothetical protein
MPLVVTTKDRWVLQVFQMHLSKEVDETEKNEISKE